MLFGVTACQNHRMMQNHAGSSYVGTILKEQYMRLILDGHKTCQLMSKRLTIGAECEYMLFHANQPARKNGCSHNVIARLLDRVPLGPFRSGAELLRAAERENFKTGMDEGELDEYIAKQRSREVWAYRFEDAVVAGDQEVVWDDSYGNNNSGFLPCYNETRKRMRFSVVRLCVCFV